MEEKGRRRILEDAMRGGKESEEGRAESQLYCCVFSQCQQQRKWNRTAKYTNSTMRQHA